MDSAKRTQKTVSGLYEGTGEKSGKEGGGFRLLGENARV